MAHTFEDLLDVIIDPRDEHRGWVLGGRVAWACGKATAEGHDIAPLITCALREGLSQDSADKIARRFRRAGR